MAIHLLSQSALALSGLAVLATIACAKPPTTENPALPDGFMNAKVPDVEAAGYFYVRQTGQTLIKAGSVPGVSADMSVQSLQVILGTDSKDAGVAATFGTASDAGAAKGFLMAKDASSQPGLSGNVMTLGQGNAEWVKAAAAGFREGGTVPVTTKFAGGYALLKYFPEKGPGTPAAVALLHMDGHHLADLKSRSDMIMLQNALSRSKIGDVAAVLYVDEALVIDQDVLGTKGQGGNSRPTALLVGQMGYSSWAVGGLFSTFATAAGLREIEVEGKKVYRYGAEDAPFKVLVANKGNLLYIAVGDDESKVAKAIMGVLK